MSTVDIYFEMINFRLFILDRQSNFKSDSSPMEDYSVNFYSGKENFESAIKLIKNT